MNKPELEALLGKPVAYLGTNLGGESEAFMSERQAEFWSNGACKVEPLYLRSEARQEPTRSAAVTEERIAGLVHTQRQTAKLLRESRDGYHPSWSDHMETVADELEAAFAARPAETVAIPVGWHLVPEVPTEDQMNAGLYQASHDAEYADVCQSYMDMVRTPVDLPDGVVVTTLPQVEPFGYFCECKGADPAFLRKPSYIPPSDELHRTTPLYATPQPVPGVVEALREARKFIRAYYEPTIATDRKLMTDIDAALASIDEVKE